MSYPLGTAVYVEGRLDWGPAVAAQAELTQVDTSLPLSSYSGGLQVISRYARRDRELAYRDNAVASMLSDLSYRMAAVWGYNPPVLRLQGSAARVIYLASLDLPATPQLAQVSYVTSSSVPTDSLEVDRMLYARDLHILQEVAQRAAVVLRHSSTVMSAVVSGYDGTLVEVQGHPYSTGCEVALAVVDSLPAWATPSGTVPGLSQAYWVRKVDDDHVSLHTSQAHAIAGTNQIVVSADLRGDHHSLLLWSFGLGVPPAWPAAGGARSRQEVHAVLPLNADLFNVPDRNLAWRDNVLAGYAGRLVDQLDDPYSKATRLYIRVVKSDDFNDPDNRPPEVYALLQDGVDFKVWAAEPLLPGRLRLQYSKLDKSIRWTTEDAGHLHVPQPAAPEFLGIEVGQELNLLSQIPDRPTAGFWRDKARRLRFPGHQESRFALVPNPGLSMVRLPSLTSYPLLSGGLVSSTAGQVRVRLSGQVVVAWQAGTYPQGVVVRHAGSYWTSLRTASATPGTDALQWRSSPHQPNVAVWINVAPMSKVSIGAVHQSTSLAQSPEGGVEFSPVNHTARFPIRLPSGNWELELEYYSKSTFPAPSSFAVTIRFGGEVVSTTPLPYGKVSGTKTSERFSVLANGQVQDLVLEWNQPAGPDVLIVSGITFKSDLSTKVRYKLSASLGGYPVGTVNFMGQRDQVSTIRFAGQVPANLTDPELHVDVLTSEDAPLEIMAVEASSLSTVHVGTAGAAGFERWRYELRSRLERTLVDSYSGSLDRYTVKPGEIEDDVEYDVVSGSLIYDGTSYSSGDSFTGGNGVSQYEITSSKTVLVKVSDPLPRFTAADTEIWGNSSTREWIEFLQSGEPELYQVLSDAKPSDTGKPCLVPRGLELTGTDVVNRLPTEDQLPVIQAFEPWMIRIGIKVLVSDLVNLGDHAGWVGEFTVA